MFHGPEEGMSSVQCCSIVYHDIITIAIYHGQVFT